MLWHHKSFHPVLDSSLYLQLQTLHLPVNCQTFFVYPCQSPSFLHSPSIKCYQIFSSIRYWFIQLDHQLIVSTTSSYSFQSVAHSLLCLSVNTITFKKILTNTPLNTYQLLYIRMYTWNIRISTNVILFHFFKQFLFLTILKNVTYLIWKFSFLTVMNNFLTCNLRES